MPTDNLPRSAAGPHSPWLIAVIVSIATFMEVLDTTIANVALRYIAGGIAVSQDESTYILTSYLVSNAIVLPISGWLSNVIGRKRFYMGCVALFTASSVMCGLSTSLTQILFFRVLQGIGGGGLAPTEQSIFADSFTPAKRALAFSIYGFTVVTAPAIGPVLGGWLTDNFSWHWVFLINLPFGLLSLTLVYFFVYDSDQLKKDRRELLARGVKIDYIGFLLVALAFGTLQIFLDRYERDDGFSSTFITTLFVIWTTSLVVLLIWEWFHPQPIMDVRLWGVRSFAICSVVMFAFGAIIISTTQLLPQLTQTLMGYDAETAGMTLGAGGIVSIMVMPIAGLVTGRLIQPKWLIGIALLGVAYAMYYASGLDLGASFWAVSLARVWTTVWLPFIFIPLSAVSYIGVPPKQNPEASALINLMRNLGGSVGVSFTTAELAWRGQFHWERLHEGVNPYNPNLFGKAMGPIVAAIRQQSQMLSYIDVFTILALVALCVAPLAIFLPRAQKGAPAGH
ncbi:MAG: DHA2 family efflux MFS transporter permease subunit [Pseudomonadota bacterium]|nr:DHA2 family efflux MFS transporter permease subunit [Pseudomonadota bacterium]MDQ2802754.1 DHA2 family efflux MFS transporter permease subunit [Pseudomonadota bacterium]